MHYTTYELLLAAGFVIAAIALGTLQVVGLLVWLAGCQPSAPRPLALPRPASASNPTTVLPTASAGEFTAQRSEVGRPWRTFS